LIQFIPKARNTRADSDFPTIVFKGPLPTRPGMDQLVADSWVEIAPSEFVAPESDPA